jgi:hypothetical protein
MRKIITKSIRSLRDMYASGTTLIPSVARHSEVRDRVSLDAAYAIINVSSRMLKNRKRYYWEEPVGPFR